MRFFCLFLALCFLGTMEVQSQNCNCSILSNDQLKSLVALNDTIGIKRAVNDLDKETSFPCTFQKWNLSIQFYIAKKQLNQADSLIKISEQKIPKNDCSENYQLAVLLNKARYFKAALNYEELSDQSFKALALAEKLKDTRSILAAYQLIVHLFTRQSEDEKNWLYVQKAAALIRNENDPKYKAEDLNWLAFEYEKKYTLTENIKLLDTAIAYSLEAKQLAIKKQNYAEIVRCFRIQEANAYHRGRLLEAIKFIDSAIDYAKASPLRINPATLYFSKAWDYMDLKKFDEAQLWQDSSLYYAEKIEGRSPATMSLYGEAAKLYEAAGNINKAYSTYKQYGKMKDSLFNLQRTEKINELEQKYEKTKNEATIKELAQQKQLYLLLAIAGILLALSIAFYLRQQQLKHKQNILETEQRLNRARMNPHFFFNALSSLQKFALQEQDPMTLASNLSKFSHIMRETLESTYKEYVTVEQEIDFLNEYLELQKIRFPKTFGYSVSASNDLDIETLLLPSMIIQPFVENSIEHGFVGINYPGEISISFKEEKNELCITIYDNGKGLLESGKVHSEHISRASQIIKDRIYLLNIKLKTKARFNLENHPSGTGVLVTIYLPILTKSENQVTNA